MALGQKDVSKIHLSELSEYRYVKLLNVMWFKVSVLFICSIQFLRHIKDFFQVVYKVESSVEELGEDINNDSNDFVSRQVVSLSCVGIGFSNFSKGIL